jgi:DNA-directed RNA polymerase subunit RPC12/RpoP
MAVQCPNCGSRFLREAKPRNAAERLGRWRFVSPLRCGDCKTRFVASTISFGDLRYAHCPKCDRMDLNRWTGKTFDPPFWIGLKASLGANRWRCEYCRLNFSSFRPRKEIFTFSRWAKMHAASGDAGKGPEAQPEGRAAEER